MLFLKLLLKPNLEPYYHEKNTCHTCFSCSLIACNKSDNLEQITYFGEDKLQELSPNKSRSASDVNSFFENTSAVISINLDNSQHYTIEYNIEYVGEESFPGEYYLDGMVNYAKAISSDHVPHASFYEEGLITSFLYDFSTNTISNLRRYRDISYHLERSKVDDSYPTIQTHVQLRVLDNSGVWHQRVIEQVVLRID
jgi:hypothetical protein